MKLPKMPDLFPGRKDDAKLLCGLALAVGIATAYLGSGDKPWSEGKWLNVGKVSAVLVALAFPAQVAKAMDAVYRRGRDEGREGGFQQGYWTPNPALEGRRDENPAERVVSTGREIASEVGELVVDRVKTAAFNHMMSGASDFLDDPRAFFTGAALDEKAESLPPGWSYDDAGRLRDEHGRYASPEAIHGWRG